MLGKLLMVAVVTALFLMSVVVSTVSAQVLLPAQTGNAGLLGTTGTSIALVLVLGVFAATMVAGARTATRGQHKRSSVKRRGFWRRR